MVYSFSMTKKHYIAVAALIKRETDYVNTLDNDPWEAAASYCPVARVAEGLADLFKADNARFDRERFLSACGVKRNK